MKVTLAQLNPKVGDIDGNLAKAREAIDRVADEKPDLVVFPELFLTGYPPQDLLERPWFIKKQEEALQELVEVSRRHKDTGIIMGAALPNRKEAGRGLHNAAVLIYYGEMVFQQPKSLLPTYDVFDEARYFDPAEKIRTCPFQGWNLGISVCEDAWNDPSLWPAGRFYDLDPISVLAGAGGRKNIIINIAASPFQAGKDTTRFGLLNGHASRHGSPLVFVNQVGGNDELIFDGRSMVLDRKGQPIAMLLPCQEQIETVDLETPGLPDLFQPEDRVASVHQALVLGIRDYLGKSGFKSAVVGLSGGIDSAVTCALAVEALGRDNVVGVTMPSVFSSEGSINDSRELAGNLGVDFRVISINGIFKSYLLALKPHFQKRKMDVAEENIQARIRGNLLMAFSNKFGHMLLATGNKSEMAMGYCTLYGDMSGGLAVISDVPKTMVYDLARYINRKREIIPQATIDKAPSAELRPDQKDEDSLPPYPVLDQILNLYIEDGLSRDEIIGRGFEPETTAWVIRTINRNEYKRWQAPPGLKVTSKAFGVGRRMPLVAKFDF